MEPCDHEGEEIITCESCSHEYCDMCCNDTCEWCEHMRTEQTGCPQCCGTVDEFNQTICFSCFYCDIISRYIFYDIESEKFIYHDDASDKNLIKDKDSVLKLAHDKYPKFKQLYNSFG